LTFRYLLNSENEFFFFYEVLHSQLVPLLLLGLEQLAERAVLKMRSETNFTKLESLRFKIFYLRDSAYKVFISN
jgi:uncharacterized membrane protein YGL010W